LFAHLQPCSFTVIGQSHGSVCGIDIVVRKFNESCSVGIRFAFGDYGTTAAELIRGDSYMRRPKVKLDNLVTIITVAERHDIDAAANQMGLTPSAVRKQIELVENILGTRLFIGRNGQLSLTDDGKVFFAEALRSVEHANLAEEKTIARLALKNHHLMVGHSTHLPPRLIQVINRLSIEDTHAVRIQHLSGLTSTTIRRVLEGHRSGTIGSGKPKSSMDSLGQARSHPHWIHLYSWTGDCA
jgi:DNA-binding transcriptional LysR family regulator